MGSPSQQSFHAATLGEEVLGHGGQAAPTCCTAAGTRCRGAQLRVGAAADSGDAGGEGKDGDHVVVGSYNQVDECYYYKYGLPA